MRVSAERNISDRIAISGHPVYPGYVIQGENRNLMVEAGLNILGPSYLRSVQSILKNSADLDLLLVTHSHYDHLGAAPYLKRQIPSLDVRAHKLVAPLLEKEKVLKSMNQLSEQISSYFQDLPGQCSEDIEIRSTPFGEPLSEGDVIDLGDWQCEVYETPGHTQDHLSFFLPEPGVLFPGEALGNPMIEKDNEVKVEFLSSYTGYLTSIEKLMLLLPQVKVIAMSHLCYYTGDDVPRFMEMSLRGTLRYRELIECYLDRAQGDPEKAMATMLRVEYDEKKAVTQERNAYAVNLAAQVKAVAALRSC